MTIVIILAFIICTAILLWLDRKDKDKAERTYKGISDLLSKINWNISRNHFDGKFPEMEFLSREDQDGLVSMSYKDKSDRDYIVNFYFPDHGGDKLIGVDFYLPNLSRSKLDIIFTELRGEYGEPTERHLIDAASLEWDTANGILILETYKGGASLLGFWNKEFYQSQSEDIS